MTRFARIVPVVVTAVALCAIAAAPRSMQASNENSTSPVSISIDEITRAAGPLPELDIENYM
jgi:hypothetical protein